MEYYLQTIVDVVCLQLKLRPEVAVLPNPYGDYRDGRQIIAKIAVECQVPKRMIADKLSLKKTDSIDNLIHSFRMITYKYPEALVLDRYKKCKERIDSHV